MRERTVTISGASKTFSVTGWRIGWILAPAELTDAIRKVHDFLTVGAPAPLQEGVAVALEGLGRRLLSRTRRESIGRAATCCTPRWSRRASAATSPEGAYYILADFAPLAEVAAGGGPPLDDTAFAVWLSREVGVTPVPGSSFFREGGGRSLVRFVFCKTEDMLQEAARRLRSIGRGDVAPGRGGGRAQRTPAVSRGLAVVTGATAGIGREFAEQLGCARLRSPPRGPRPAAPRRDGGGARRESPGRGGSLRGGPEPGRRRDPARRAIDRLAAARPAGQQRGLRIPRSTRGGRHRAAGGHAPAPCARADAAHPRRASGPLRPIAPAG